MSINISAQSMEFAKIVLVAWEYALNEINRGIICLEKLLLERGVDDRFLGYVQPDERYRPSAAMTISAAWGSW